MGNCIDNNRRYPRPPQNYNQNRRQAPIPHPLHMQLAPSYNIPPQNFQSPMDISLDDDGPELMQIPGTKPTPRKYIHHELSLNPGHMFQKYQGGCSQNYTHVVFVKVPSNTQQTQYQTISQPLWIFPPQIALFPPNQMKSGYFQQKMTWFRFQVERLRVDWQLGCQSMRVDRQNVLISSINQLQAINLRKQLKIKFDQQEVDDAGGVLREWMNVAMKEIFNFEMTGFLRVCDSNQKCYRFVIDPDESQDEKSFRLIIARLLGIIIGKALFERISLNCFLTKSIWRQICGKNVTFGDFYFYDKAIYSTLKMVQQNPIDTQLGLYFNYTVSYDHKSTKLVNLKPKGQQIPVTDKNKNQFITLLVNYFCVKICTDYITAIKEGISMVFPINLLQIFEPQQLEMILNGPQFIDVRQWKSSTLYKNCSPKDAQVQWFWSYVEKLDQNKLGNLLHYVTGSRRLPVLGFFYLQSNRNQINRFTIQKVGYDKHNPYPKSHTCFNRLQLPEYKTQQELNQRMGQILIDEINHFGLS